MGELSGCALPLGLVFGEHLPVDHVLHGAGDLPMLLFPRTRGKELSLIKAELDRGGLERFSHIGLLLAVLLAVVLVTGQAQK
jgi:hypothetical protein